MYFFVIIFAAIYWIIYGNFIGGCLMASLFLILIYSIRCCKKEKKQLEFKMKAQDYVITQGEKIQLIPEVSGINTWMEDYIFEIEYEIETKLYGITKSRKKKIRWNRKAGNTSVFIEKADQCDSYTLRLKSIQWEDLTGLYKVKKELDQNIYILVMPVNYELEEMNKSLQNIRSQDQGMESGEVRNYREGDRLSRIHWNLYAMTRQLWVRENEDEMMEYRKIGLDLSKISKNRISEYLSVFYSVSLFYLEEGITQEIYYGDHKFLLSHMEQYEELFTDIYAEGMKEISTDVSFIHMIQFDENEKDIQQYLYDMEL